MLKSLDRDGETDVRADERAVEPVIGAILLVAITVILAAVIGTFVIDLGEQVQETAPNAQFTFEYDEVDDNVTIIHDGGEAIDLDGGESLLVVADGADYDWAEDGGHTGVVSAGDSVTISDGDELEVSEGETIRVVWVGTEDLSATLADDESAVTIQD